MLSVLLLGVLMGLRHAFEADHLAAVASLSTRSGGASAMMRRGGAWGLGHSTTLFCVAAFCFVAGVTVPARVASMFEALVGLMLLILGGDVLRRMRRGRIHVHSHEHDGVTHIHVHRHAASIPHREDPHHHHHRARMSLRAFFIGMLHGAAGSGALVLLTLQTVASPWVGLAYVAAFGVGSIAGMMAASVAIAVPMGRSAAIVNRALPVYEAGLGMITIGVGVWILYGLY